MAGRKPDTGVQTGTVCVNSSDTFWNHIYIKNRHTQDLEYLVQDTTPKIKFQST